MMNEFPPDIDYSKLTIAEQQELSRFHSPDGYRTMALGWDMALAGTAVVRGIPLVAAVPFVGQERMWPDKSKRIYHDLLGNASEVVVVSDGAYAPWKMQARNAWMVDNCTHVLAMWDGTDGGTANCVKYAQSAGKPIINLWSPFMEIK